MWLVVALSSVVVMVVWLPLLGLMEDEEVAAGVRLGTALTTQSSTMAGGFK